MMLNLLITKSVDVDIDVNDIFQEWIEKTKGMKSPVYKDEFMSVLNLSIGILEQIPEICLPQLTKNERQKILKRLEIQILRFAAEQRKSIK